MGEVALGQQRGQRVGTGPRQRPVGRLLVSTATTSQYATEPGNSPRFRPRSKHKIKRLNFSRETQANTQRKMLSRLFCKTNPGPWGEPVLCATWTLPFSRSSTTPVTLTRITKHAFKKFTIPGQKGPPPQAQGEEKEPVLKAIKRQPNWTSDRWGTRGRRTLQVCRRHDQRIVSGPSFKEKTNSEPILKATLLTNNIPINPAIERFTDKLSPFLIGTPMSLGVSERNLPLPISVIWDSNKKYKNKRYHLAQLSQLRQQIQKLDTNHGHVS